MTPDQPQTIEDLEAARINLKRELDRWENYGGNNPDKYKTAIADARVVVHDIESKLKAAGLLELSDEERRFKELDRLFPDAGTRQVVEHEGRKFQRKFTPVATSLSGKTVKAWRAYWVELSGVQNG